MRFILKKIFTYQEHINYQTINITKKRSINKITRKKTEQIMIYIELKRQKNIIKPHSKDADYNKYKLIYLIPVNKEISYSQEYISIFIFKTNYKYLYYQSLVYFLNNY